MKKQISMLKLWSLVGLVVCALLIEAFISPLLVHAAPWSSITQRQGVIQNDQNGSILNSHTAQIGERMRVRIQVDTNSGSDPKQLVFKLQYDKNNNSWSDVGPTSEIRAARSETIGLSSKIGTGEGGTCQGGTTKAEGYQANQVAKTKSLRINSSTCKEIGFVIDTQNAATNTTYRFRLYNVTEAATLSSYAAYPSFSTTSSNDMRTSKSNTPNLSTGYADLKTLLDAQGYSNTATDDAAREIIKNVTGDTTADVTIDGSASTQLGMFSTTAGDVNGDGYDDVIVGAPGYSSNTGRAYIYLGGSIMSTSPWKTFTGGATGDYFGTSSGTAGDVNGDGYDDVVIGAVAGASTYNRGYVYYGGANMDTTADVSFSGSAVNGFGSPFLYDNVSTAGDVNGDGFDDVIFGDLLHIYLTGRAQIFFGGSAMDNTADVTLTGAGGSSGLGASATWAGNVNGDGYDDVIVGGANNTAYIYYGGSSMDSTADVTITGSSSIQFAISLSRVGDVNGDGFDDVIVGAPGYSTNTGRAYIYYGGSSMNNVVDVTLTGTATQNFFGNNLDYLGDINGDGYADVTVGAHGYSTNTGRAYIYYGGSAMDTTADVTLTGGSTGHYFGASVANGGDVNGDGFDDLIVGSYGYSSSAGRVYVYFQSQATNNTADRIWTGAASGLLGNLVANAGDVNGDGYDDILMSNKHYSSNTGQAYIYLGGPKATTGAWLTFTGAGAGYLFGTGIAGGDDLNGDGYDDIIIGEPDNSGGRAYVYFGGPNMDTTADVTLSDSNGNFGYTVSAAGDVNGDGYGDVLASAISYGGGNGRAALFYGGASMNGVADVIFSGAGCGGDFGYATSSGDVNGDGYSDLAIAQGCNKTAQWSGEGRVNLFYGGASMNNTVDWFVEGPPGMGVGSSVFSGSDINGDGYTDLLIGSSGYSSGTGRAFVYFGGSTFDTTSDVTLTGEATGNNFGNTITSVDANGDGYGDVVVGAYYYSSQAGRAYTFYGGPSMDTTADITMTGASSNRLGTSIAGINNFNGDGYGDIAVGLPGYSSNAGRTHLYYGGRSDQIPIVQKVIKSSETCSGLTSIDTIWNGQSDVAASSKNITLQAYRFGSTNAWTTVTTNNSLAANTDSDITGSLTTNLSEYCDGNDWSYWRVYQASGTNTLQTDSFEIDIVGGGGNTDPNAPSSMTQIKVTGGSTVPTGGWTNESQIKISATASDPDASDTLQLCVEQQLLGTPFTGSGEVCGSGVSYSGTPIIVESTLTGLSEGEYHWQARVKDSGGLYSSWLSYGGNAETDRDFGSDASNPAGNVYDGTSTGVDATFNNGSLTTLSANWASNSNISGLSGYEYSIGTSPGDTTILGWTSAGTSTSVTVGSLSLATSQAYFFNIRVTDNASNAAILSSNGQTVAPSLTFSSSDTTVDLGRVNAGNSGTTSQTTSLTVATNAKNGYKVYGKATDFLKSQSLEIIPMFSAGSYATPAAWGANTGFGYHSSDSTVGGSNRFNNASCPGGGNAPCFAPYTTAGIGDVIADGDTLPNGGPAFNDSITITNKAAIDLSSQQAGRYQTTILYSAYATY